ncbi:hypothetical protein B296_00013024 [Ensete ventricosum]|uniref:KNOX1 domain-containing protein n=1 Tax=Ensete ventricosum TaxID=4639 RepID=A0A426Z6H1_ENSVE|nr:hypothetical protein B296_00013024 [Ensete ventricosum]
MEELSHLGGDFVSSTTTTTSAPPRPNAAVYGRNCYPTSAMLPYLQPGAGSSLQASLVRAVEGRGGQGEMCPSDAEDVRAKIMSHPQYSSLIGAYIDCQKVRSHNPNDPNVTTAAVESLRGCVNVRYGVGRKAEAAYSISIARLH